MTTKEATEIIKCHYNDVERYIDAERLKDKKYYDEKRHEYCVSIAEVDWQPTADVQKVKHGKWIWITNSDRPDTIICTECDIGFDVWKHEIIDFNYCPHCGAKMDKEIDI